MLKHLPLLMITAGCVEYKFSDEDVEAAPALGEDSGAPGPTDDTAAADPPDSGEPSNPDVPPEDTGTPPDPDPEPESCEDITVEDTVEIDESCRSEPVTGTMAVTTEWSLTVPEGYPEYAQIISAPAVGQLTDDNGDGLIDNLDTPDIVANFDDAGTEGSAHGVLRWMTGDGSDNGIILDRWVDEFTDDQYFPYRYAGVALGDVTGDGHPDIVTLLERVGGAPPDGPPDDPPPDEDTDHPVGPPPPPTEGEGPPGLPCHVVAMDIDGTIHWVSEASVDCGGHAPAIADLEGDGDVEIVIGPNVFDGTTGDLDHEGAAGSCFHYAYPEIGMIPAISDLDGDGTQEILAGSTIYDAEANILCTRSDPEADGYPASADFNGDGMGEVVVVGNNQAAVMDRFCSESAAWTLPGEGTGGPPTVADFDADGTPEIGIATATHYAVYESDGALIWQAEVIDASSHATGSTVFDFEGDGRPEVVYADETHLWVFDGPTGDVRVSDPGHTSRTLHEFPLVVDVDNDGAPEIVVPNGGGHHGVVHEGLYVVGSADDSWLGGRTTWNQHAYNIVNINDDLTVPAAPEPNWPLHNNFRSGDLNPVYGENAPDAIPLAEVCTEECDAGNLIIGMRLANRGTATLRTDMKLTVYRPTEPEWTVVEVLHVSPPIEPGTSSELLELSLDTSVLGPEGLAIMVDDDSGTEAIRECDEENNLIMLSDAVCP